MHAALNEITTILEKVELVLTSDLEDFAKVTIGRPFPSDDYKAAIGDALLLVRLNIEGTIGNLAIVGARYQDGKPFYPFIPNVYLAMAKYLLKQNKPRKRGVFIKVRKTRNGEPIYTRTQ